MRYTAEQMHTIINEWQTSGLSKKAFCRERNIASATFHYWYNRITKSPSTGFTELALPQREQTSLFEIVFPSGVRMIFQGEPSASWLREVLS